MPVCKKCKKQFKNLEKIDGKVRNLCKRKYCLECSPFKQHNTKILEIKRENKKATKCNCILCNNVYFYIRGNGSNLKKCSSCIVKERKVNTRIKLIKENGLSCSICGYNKSISALDFHHLDPTKKEFDLSARNMNRKYSSLLEESKKCILLCANCHREIHSHNSEV